MDRYWNEEFGCFIAKLSRSFSFIRNIWAPMGVDPGILDWFETDEGGAKAEKALGVIGKEYFVYLELETQRFKVIDKKFTHILVDQEIPPKLPKFGTIVPIYKHNGANKVKVQKIGDEVFVNGQKIILRSVTFKDTPDNIERAIEEAIKENDAMPVSASILDALLKFPYSLIPKHWGEKIRDEEHGDTFTPFIIFSGTIYGESNDKGVRGLSNREEGWRGSYLTIGNFWDYRYRIAVIEPPKPNK